ncbi:DUF397 domain-containing protein [Kitasatospora sp. NPDC127060]|uniref:DUF397 domain-containing protein n=1 Tax=Kitasatospora sp. NPDC127060 TaxID=3347121 RepID=UPI003656DE5C
MPAAPFIPPDEWESYSGDSGQCVRWRNPPGETPGERIEIGDSKDPDGPTLILPMESWLRFHAWAARMEA